MPENLGNDPHYYHPPYEGQVFPDVLDSSVVVITAPADQREQAQQLQARFAERAAREPAFEGYDHCVAFNVQSLDRWLREGYFFGFLLLHPGMTQEQLERADAAPLTDEERDIIYRLQNPLCVYGELSAPTEELMQGFRELTGAKLVRDDLQNGNQFGKRVWLGEWSDQRIFLTEENRQNPDEDIPYLRWSVLTEEDGQYELLDLSKKDRDALKESGVKLEDAIQNQTVDRRNMAEIIRIHREL